MKKFDGIKWLVKDECQWIRPEKKEVWKITTIVFCKFPFPVLLFNNNYTFCIQEEFIDYVRNPLAEVEFRFDGYEFKRKVIQDKPNHYLILILFNGCYDGPIEFSKFSMNDIYSQYESDGFKTDIKNSKNKKLLDIYNKYMA
jgi:hypothetical protein